MALITEFYQMIKDMIAGEYPDYVMKNRAGDEIPVFVYHHVDKINFRDHLQFLYNNGYQTLNIAQLDQLLSAKQKPTGKEVLLTFDDGLEDLYTVAYPLLRSFRFQGIAFIAPYWIGEQGLVTWQQVEEMHQSGMIDFQAHSYMHARIYASPKIVDFFHPKLCYHHRWQFPLINDGSGHVSKQVPGLGMPIYQFSSSLSESKRYLGNPDLETFCVDYVKEHGEADFFNHPLWRKHLEKVIRSFSQNGSNKNLYETEEEQRERVKQEIEKSKKVIEKKLSGKKVTAFSYPYFERGNMTDQLLREYGYRFVFGGLGKDSHFNSNHTGVRYFQRVNGDFVQRLIGNGRVALWRLLFLKMWRRLTGVAMY
jgi:peptidoglycan/xylan/chitin deacetylase (PgdA/CDA1 family)